MNSPLQHKTTHITTKTPLKIAQLNANGIDRFPDEVTAFCNKKKTDIILLTETFLLKDNLYTEWTQYHNYATLPPNATRGHGGLSILARPDFPHHIHHHPNPNNYTITISIDKYTIHGLYLPPQLDLDTYKAILVNIPITTTTIILGDLNTRLGATIGDTRTNQRHHIFEEWQTQHSIINWNHTFAFGQPTLRSNIGTSIIDFFLSPDGPTFATEVHIHDEISLNSDHHLCEATFQLDHDIPILSPPSAPRKHWKLQRLNEPIIKQKYVSIFEELSTPTLHHLQTILDQSLSPTYQCAQAQMDIDNIANVITQHIHAALDLSVTPSKARPKTWNWFWTEDLQQLANTRQQCYNKWRNSNNPINDHQLWTNYTNAKASFNKAVKANRAHKWKQFAQNLREAKGNELYQYIKNKKKKQIHTTRPKRCCRKNAYTFCLSLRRPSSIHHIPLHNHHPFHHHTPIHTNTIIYPTYHQHRTTTTQSTR
jgi:hypothetical protein